MTDLHPTAVIDRDAVLGAGVSVGPYAVIGPDVTIADGCVIGPHAVLERSTRLGPRCTIGVGAVLGSDPQDEKYDGGATWLSVGEGTRIREYATLNRGSSGGGTTRVGRHCLVMAYAHVGHDCQIGDEVVLTNAVQLGGHVQVEAHGQIGGATAVHQFVRIGTHAFVGGGSRVPQDVPPYVRAAGNPLRLYGLNGVGLRRAAFSADLRHALKHAYRLLFNSSLTTSEAIASLRAEPDLPGEVQRLVEFVAASERGVLVCAAS